jgi:hypothetical protein
MGHSTHKYPRKSITIGGTAGLSGGVGATADTAMSFVGEILTRVLLECYNSNNGLTRTLAFLDAQGVTAYSAAAIADAANTSWAPTGGIELDGTYNLRLLQSGAGATAGVDYLTLFTR